MPILYNVGNKLTAGSEPPQLYRYQDRVLGDGGTLETRDEASTFIRRLRSAGVLGSTVIAGVAGGYKAGTLYSIIGPDLDVTRGTVKNRVNRAGVLSEVASGVPATDFAGGVLRGTTVEPSAVNLALHSEAFNNIYWGKSETTVSDNVGIAPDGTNTLDKLIPSVNNSIHFISTSGKSFTSGTTYSWSVFAKADGYDHIRLAFGSEAFPVSGRAASFNIATGTIGQTQSGVTARIKAYPNGIYRCSITITATATASSFAFINSQNADSATAITFTGDGTSGALLWGAQLETGSVATSYIKTEGSAQPRNADVITKTGLGSVLPQTEGWYYGQFTLTHTDFSIQRGLFGIGDGSGMAGFELLINGRFGYRGSSFGNILTVGTYRFMYVVKSQYSVCDLFVNGVKIGTVNASVLTSRSVLSVGAITTFTPQRQLNDPIHSYAIGSGAITDASAIQLTTL
jgi:hypothetical protein